MAFSDEIPNTNISSPNLTTMSTVFDMVSPSSCDQEALPFDFKDLLSIPDFNPSLFDWPPLPATTLPDTTTAINHPLPSQPSSNVEVLNSPSNETTAANNGEAGNQHGAEDEGGHGDVAREDDQDQDRTKKLLKPKKRHQKREIGPRFAFMTKSKVDLLDDGYKWRKYGQKALKSSPHPRSYYRCSTPGCGVKKFVERSSDNNSIVKTTYEGMHTHVSPAIQSLGLHLHPNAGEAIAHPNLVLPQLHQYHQFHQQQNVMQLAAPFVYNSTPPLSIVGPAAGNHMNHSSFGGYVQDHWVQGGFGSSRLVHEALCRDTGLLQDIVWPTQMRRD